MEVERDYENINLSLILILNFDYYATFTLKNSVRISHVLYYGLIHILLNDLHQSVNMLCATY